MGGVLHEGRPAGRRQGFEPLNRCGLAEEVNRNDGLGPGSDRFSGAHRVDQQVNRVYVHWDRPRANPRNGFGCGDKGIGRHDDFPARPYTAGAQGEFQRISAVGHPHAVSGSKKFRICLFKFGHGRAADEGGLGEDFFHADFDFVGDFFLLCAQINQRNRCRKVHDWSPSATLG